MWTKEQIANCKHRWYLKNKEKVTSRKRQWLLENKDKEGYKIRHRQRSVRYRLKHPDRVVRIRHENYLNHKVARNLYGKEYAITHAQERREYIESSFRTFLSVVVIRSKAHDRLKKRENNISLEYVVKLGESQNWRCAISNEMMTHKYNNLWAVSIDRKDSSKGHIKGNVQLVCKFINLGKGNHSDFEVHSFIQSVRNNASGLLNRVTGS